jgi:predicted secreted hydrolase
MKPLKFRACLAAVKFGATGAALLAISSVSKAANGFLPALPGYKFSFPRDDAAHPRYASEWWYYTGHLKATDGHRFGYQVTFFRVGLSPRPLHRASAWAANQLILGHFAITDETNRRFYFCDRASRAAVQLAGASTKRPHVWLYNWDLNFTAAGQHLHAGDRSLDSENKGTVMALSLQLVPQKPAVVHGINGVSQKSAGRGHASHYYSYTRLRTSGSLRLGNETYRVEGQSWFDKEFGSSQLTSNQVGWDWFALQLANGQELMLYRMRLRDGTPDRYASGTFVEKNGAAHHLRYNEFSMKPLSTWLSPQTATRYPATWRVRLPGRHIDLQLTPTVSAQELITTRSTNLTYWEGSVVIKGTAGGAAITGQGYIELTGYRTPFSVNF